MNCYQLHTDELGLLDDIARVSDHRHVDEFAFKRDCPQAFFLRFLVDCIQLASASDIFRRWRKDLVCYVDLGRVDGPFSRHAQDFRAYTLPTVAIRILEVEVWAIDSSDAGRTGGNDYFVTRVVPEVTGVGVEIVADEPGVDALRGAVVGGTEDQGFQARARTRYLFHVGHGYYLFYEHFEANTPRSLQALLYLREEHVDPP